jgi:diphosphomevalonate decarboxylase
VQERLERCKRAIYERDFSTFAEVVELDSNLMHAVMMTSKPPLFYWQPPSLAVMEQVRMWRAEGIHVCYTMDAGPNVHCICLQEDSDTVAQRLNNMAGVKVVHKAGVGGGAALLA